jgi:hypothetical protein
MCRDIVAASQGDPPDDTLHPLLSVDGLSFQLLPSPTLYFWDPTKVYLVSCVYLLDHSTTCLGATSNKSNFVLPIQNSVSARDIWSPWWAYVGRCHIGRHYQVVEMIELLW